MLRRASEREKVARDVLCHATWAYGLSVETWCDREKRLRDVPWARDGMATWLWIDANDRVLSSCETFAMRAEVHDAHGIRGGHVYAVASVFTEQALRGRGHATQMMRALPEAVRSMDAKALGLILFSDVGTELYGRSGYVARPSLDWTWPARPSSIEEAKLLQHGDFPTLRARPWPHAWRIVPDRGQFAWHLAREQFYAEAWNRPRPRAVGMHTASGSALWVARYHVEELAILWLDAIEPDDVGTLMQAAQSIAYDTGLKLVRAWDVNGAAHAEGGTQQARDTEIPMVASLGAELTSLPWIDVQRMFWV